MRIVHLAAEFAPFAKAGGLGEVITGLSREQGNTDHEVHVILPKYDFFHLENLEKESVSFNVRMWDQDFPNTMWHVKYANIHLHLLEEHHPHSYFRRGKIYGFDDDAPRFLYFSKAAIEYLKAKGEQVDILHLHDWHTAAATSLAKSSNAPVKKIVLSLHNLEYQGTCGRQDLELFGISNPEIYRDSKHSESYKLLKGGIEEAHTIIAVSPTYAKEILTPHFGFDLDQDLIRNKSKLYGVLNGIDFELWNPANDPHLSTHFQPHDSIEKILACKQTIQETLAHRFNLEEGSENRPWVGAITRIVPQKGPELLEAALEHTIRNGGIFALLGSSPIPEMQHHFEKLKRKYHSHRQVLIELCFDEQLAHQLYAALDFTIIPSHFEPCGLTQMTSMHYGTIPIAHATGGLKDTVTEKSGYPFTKLTPPALHEAMDKAFSTRLKDPAKHQGLILKGVQADYSWKKPTQEYLRLYAKESLI